MINLLQMSISAAVLIAVILVVRALFLNRLPKRTFKILWAVVIARMLIPFSLPVLPSIADEPAQTVQTYNTAKPSGYTMIENQWSAQAAVEGEGKETAPKNENADNGRIAEIIWLCGAALTFGYFVFSHRRQSRGYKAALPCKNKLVCDMVNSFGVKRKINIRISDEISSPLTYGVIEPTILIPEHMSSLTRVQLEYVLAHEVMHIKKCDVLYKWFLTLAVCLHWFNPLAWVMLVMANRDIELVCDEAVLKSREDARRDYALMLIEMEEKRKPMLYAGFGSSSVKERIVTIMKFKRTTIVGIAASICLVAGSMAVFAAENDNADTDPETQAAVQQTVSAADETKNELPDVSGMTVDEAKTAIEEAGYKPVIREMCSDEVEEGKVIKAEFSENGEVFIFVSRGSLENYTVDAETETDTVVTVEDPDGSGVEGVYNGDIIISEDGCYDVEIGEMYDIDSELEKNGIITDDNGDYTYNGKQIAGLISVSDDGVFVISNSNAENGIYIKVSDSGVEEVSEEEFNSDFELSEDENGMVSYSTEVEVDV